jgi:hypothetical protein
MLEERIVFRRNVLGAFEGQRGDPGGVSGKYLMGQAEKGLAFACGCDRLYLKACHHAPALDLRGLLVRGLRAAGGAMSLALPASILYRQSAISDQAGRWVMAIMV